MPTLEHNQGSLNYFLFFFQKGTFSKTIYNKLYKWCIIFISKNENYSGKLFSPTFKYVVYVCAYVYVWNLNWENFVLASKNFVIKKQFNFIHKIEKILRFI